MCDKPIHLSLQQAQQLMLMAQGLDHLPSRPATSVDVLETIQRMGALQIDTINVVARSSYLVLWSRLGDYQHTWLDDLLATGALFEYWAHEACLLPMEDYPIYRRLMLTYEQENRSARDWITAHPDVVERVLAHIREQGATRSADFARTDGKTGGWWNWKDEKWALDYLHGIGQLMIARRHNFQRLYDLRERVLPQWDDTQALAADQIQRTLTIKAVQALGIATARWVPDYFRTPNDGIADLLETLVAEGVLLRATIADWDTAAYIHHSSAGRLQDIIAGKSPPTLTTLLSPFDPLIWDRARAKALFGFQYTLECYTPAAKRRYGYFCLPLLYRGQLVGRLDAKAHRKTGVFEIKAFYLEPDVPMSDTLLSEVAYMLQRCAQWHHTPEVVLRMTDPPDLARLLTPLV